MNGAQASPATEIEAVLNVHGFTDEIERPAVFGWLRRMDAMLTKSLNVRTKGAHGDPVS